MLAAAHELGVVLLLLVRVGIGAKVLGGPRKPWPSTAASRSVNTMHSAWADVTAGVGLGLAAMVWGVCTGSAEALVGVDSDGSPEV